MAFEPIESNTDNSEHKYSLPTVNQYVKAEVEAGNNKIFETALIVEHIEVGGKNGEWIKITTEKCVGLLHKNTKLGANVLTLKNGLSGKAYAMAIMPTQKGKPGFIIGVDKEITRYWVQVHGATIAYESESEADNSQKELTLKDFAIPEVIEALEEDVKNMKQNQKKEKQSGPGQTTAPNKP